MFIDHIEKCAVDEECEILLCHLERLNGDLQPAIDPLDILAACEVLTGVKDHKDDLND